MQKCKCLAHVKYKQDFDDDDDVVATAINKCCLILLSALDHNTTVNAVFAALLSSNKYFRYFKCGSSLKA